VVVRSGFCKPMESSDTTRFELCSRRGLGSAFGNEDPYTPSEYLEVSRVLGQYDGRAYVVGCYARRVTIYDQQVRALNLVYAVDQEQGLSPASA